MIISFSLFRFFTRFGGFLCWCEYVCLCYFLCTLCEHYCSKNLCSLCHKFLWHLPYASVIFHKLCNICRWELVEWWLFHSFCVSFSLWTYENQFLRLDRSVLLLLLSSSSSLLFLGRKKAHKLDLYFPSSTFLHFLFFLLPSHIFSVKSKLLLLKTCRPIFLLQIATNEKQNIEKVCFLLTALMLVTKINTNKSGEQAFSSFIWDSIASSSTMILCCTLYPVNCALHTAHVSFSLSCVRKKSIEIA